MKLRSKLILSFICLVAVLSFPFAVTVIKSQETRDQVERLISVNIEEVELSSQFSYGVQRIKSNLRELILEIVLDPKETEITRSQAIVAEHIAQLREISKKWKEAVLLDLEENEGEQEEAVVEAERNEMAELERVLLMQEDFVKATERFLVLYRESAATPKMIYEYFEDHVEPISRDLQVHVKRLHDDVIAEASREGRIFEQELEEAEQIVLVFIIVSLVLAVVIALLIASRITRPLQELSDVTSRITLDDLNQRVDVYSMDEVGILSQRFNDMLDQLQENIKRRQASDLELRELNQLLEQRVEERTRNLMEAREAAERASQAKSEFLSSMSHELRTPLNAILGFAQLMEHSKRHPLDEKQKKNIGQIIKAGGFLLDLIDQLLELNNIETGDVSVKLDSVSARDVISESLVLVERRAKEAKVEVLDLTQNDNLPKLNSDKMRLRQVLVNLLSNAVKYNKPGGEVRVTSELLQGWLKIVITDTGLGIAPELQCNLFKPFERLGRESGQVEGTGIGLVIAKKILDKLGGRIGFESEAGRGSVFWIEVPVDGEGSPVQGAEDKPSQVSLEEAQTHIDTGHFAHTVLYVEDNLENIKLMSDLIGEIEDCGFVATLNAREGLKAARQRQPDVILMDICLPGMTGLEALEILKQDPATQSIPVIAVSASAMPDDIKKGMKAGFADYITKPFDLMKLLEKVRGIISQK